jgi:hypothetical protein
MALHEQSGQVWTDELESRMNENVHVRFGGGLTEKYHVSPIHGNSPASYPTTTGTTTTAVGWGWRLISFPGIRPPELSCGYGFTTEV